MHIIKRILRWIMHPLLGLPPKQTEAVGYAFVFFAAATFAVWAQEAKSLVNDAQIWRSNQMLYYIWTLLGDGHSHETYIRLRPMFWESFDRINKLEKIKDDFWVGWLSRLNTILFIVGAIFVVIAKWRDGRKSSSASGSP